MMILVLINIFCQLGSVVKTDTVQHNFKVYKNHDINTTIGNSNLISNINKMSELFCVVSCNSNHNCLTAVYDNSQERNCFINSRYFKTNELIQSKTSIITEKIRVCCSSFDRNVCLKRSILYKKRRL